MQHFSPVLQHFSPVSQHLLSWLSSYITAMSLKVSGTGCLCILAVNVSLCSVLATNNSSCPPWHYYNHVAGECWCGFDLICNGDQVEIESTFCATSSWKENSSFIAQCPFRPTFNVINRMHSEMPTNVSQLDELMCGPYKRKGLLCSECEEGYGPAGYSIDKKCTDFSSLRSRYILRFSVPFSSFRSDDIDFYTPGVFLTLTSHQDRCWDM
jgi:hypothetical protein